MINTKTLFRVDLASLLSRIQKIHQLENSLSICLHHDNFTSSDVKSAKDLLKLDSKSVLALLTLLREKSQNFELFDSDDINELYDSIQKNTSKEILSQFEIYEDYCKRRKAYFKEKNSYHTPEEIQDLFDKRKYELAYPSVVYYHEKQHDARMHSKLAFYYENGIKVKKDLAKAREFYEKAVLEAEEFEYCFKLYQLFSDHPTKAKEYVNLGAKNGIDSCIKEKEKLDADDYLNGIKDRAFNDKSYKSDYPKMLEEARNGNVDFQAFIVIANYSGAYTGLNQKEIQKFLLNVTESRIDSKIIIKCVLSVAKYYKTRKDSQDFEKEIFQYKKIAHDLGDHTQSIDLALMSFYQRNYQDAATYFNEAFKNKISGGSLALNECVNYGRKQSAIYQDKKNEDNRKLADDVFHFCLELGERSCFYDLANLYIDDYPEITMDYILKGKEKHDSLCKDGYKLFVIYAKKIAKQDPGKSKAYFLNARKLGYDSAYYGIAEAYFSIQDYESSFKEIESGIKNKESKCTKAYQLFSKTASDYLKANKIQEAIDLYLKMISIGDKEHYYELAKAYLDIGQEKSAYEALKKGKQNKDSRCLKNNLFLDKEKENEKAGKFQNACNCYLYAIELGDNSCYYELASLYLKSGQIEEAKKQFEKAKQAKDPRCKSYQLFTDYGFDMIQNGKTGQAILVFDAARLLGCKDYNLTLATCYLKQGEIDSAIKIAGLLEKQEENVDICEKFTAEAKTLHDKGQVDDAIKLLSCVLDKGCCLPARITYFEYQAEKGNTALGLKTLRKFSKFDNECSKVLHDYYKTHFKNFSLPDMYHWCRNEKSDLDYSKYSYQDVLDYIEENMNNHDSEDVFVRNTFLILSGSKEDKEKRKTMLSQQASDSDNLSSVYAGYLLLKYYDSKECDDKFIISISKKIIKQFKDELNETELSMIFGNDKVKAELFPVYLNSMLRNKINPKNGKEQLWNFPSSIEKSRFEHDIDVICQFREKHASLAGLAYDFFSELVKNDCYSYCLHLALLCDIETDDGRGKFKENAESFLKNSCNRDNTLANICLARRYAKFDTAKALKLYDKVFNACYLNHEPVKQIASEAFNICTGFFDKLKWGRRVKIVFN